MDRYRTQLKGIEIPNDLIALTIDEFPIIFIAAACAKGDTILKGAAELRSEEKHRLAAMYSAGFTPDGEPEHRLFPDVELEFAVENWQVAKWSIVLAIIVLPVVGDADTLLAHRW